MHQVGTSLPKKLVDAYPERKGGKGAKAADKEAAGQAPAQDAEAKARKEAQAEADDVAGGLARPSFAVLALSMLPRGKRCLKAAIYTASERRSRERSARLPRFPQEEETFKQALSSPDIAACCRPHPDAAVEPASLGSVEAPKAASLPMKSRQGVPLACFF